MLLLTIDLLFAKLSASRNIFANENINFMLNAVSKLLLRVHPSCAPLLLFTFFIYIIAGVLFLYQKQAPRHSHKCSNPAICSTICWPHAPVLVRHASVFRHLLSLHSYVDCFKNFEEIPYSSLHWMTKCEYKSSIRRGKMVFVTYLNASGGAVDLVFFGILGITCSNRIGNLVVYSSPWNKKRAACLEDAGLFKA